jgi:hypothetical protein
MIIKKKFHKRTQNKKIIIIIKSMREKIKIKIKLESIKKNSIKGLN